MGATRWHNFRPLRYPEVAAPAPAREFRVFRGRADSLASRRPVTPQGEERASKSSWSTEPEIDPGAQSGREGRVLQVEPVGLVLPAECACCGAVAAASQVETRAHDRASLIVPYCTECQRHVSAVTTRVLAATVASCLLAGTLAAVVPILWGSVSLVWLTLLAAVGGALPAGVGALWRRPSARGHSSSGRSVWWLPSGELACTSARWAAALADANALVARRATLRARTSSPWMLSGLILALVAAPFFHWLHRPLVRVLNLTEARLTVEVDGSSLASLEPTSAESAAAGVELRVPAGPRHLVARADDGRVLAESRVVVQAGRLHLYAPASDAHCFWLETLGYGRAQREAADLEPLVGPARFWVLPPIDSWFVPNPPPSEVDDRSSGGVLTALRQARCLHAPPVVRAATVGDASR